MLVLLVLLLLLLLLLWSCIKMNIIHCIKSRNFTWFPGVGSLWTRTDSAEFRAICGNYPFPTKLPTPGNQVKCRDFSQWLSFIFSHAGNSSRPCRPIKNSVLLNKNISQRNMRTWEEPKMWKYIWSTINKRQFHICIDNRWYQQWKLLKSRTKTFVILPRSLFFYHAIWSKNIARKNNFLHSNILLIIFSKLNSHWRPWSLYSETTKCKSNSVPGEVDIVFFRSVDMRGEAKHCI